MNVKYRLEDILLYRNCSSTYNFLVLEIRIDHSGVWYLGEDPAGQKTWHPENLLEFIE